MKTVTLFLDRNTGIGWGKPGNTLSKREVRAIA